MSMKLGSQALSLSGGLGEHWFGSLSTLSYSRAKAIALGLYCHVCLPQLSLWFFSFEKARLSLGLVCLVPFLPPHIMSLTPSLNLNVTISPLAATRSCLTPVCLS